MNVTVIDNFVSAEFVQGLRATILLDRKHTFSMTSNGTAPFYSVDFQVQEPIIQKLVNQINSSAGKNYEVKRVYANIQYSGMDGTWHTDDGDVTALLFVNDNLEGGEFEIRNTSQDVERISPTPGRLIMFEGKYLHRGLSSSTLGIPRISLAFKLWQ